MDGDAVAEGLGRDCSSDVYCDVSFCSMVCPVSLHYYRAGFVVRAPDLECTYDSSFKREMEVASRNDKNQCSVYDFMTGYCYPM